MQKSNQLIYSSSPYLLQHAYNPVDWYEWNEEALQKAKNENKLIIVSIGYSACHWCHVMEHESFENEEVATVMNENFIAIKVDREERPDIDQVYMLAVQLMNGNGGWPLNMICLPDQRPIYGGTYFRKADWINVLEQLAQLWQKDPEKAIKYAQQLEHGLHKAELIENPSDDLTLENRQLDEIVKYWKQEFDTKLGGYQRAPKFPLPNNWLFLLRYAFLKKDEEALMQVMHTLEAMAHGGIYDQIGGGFARYAVDERWHIPHFEKMIYDNAQLISLYSEAYQYLKYEPFAQVIRETITWINREMKDKNSLFYSALDADSEGKEGKFYQWDSLDFMDTVGEYQELLSEYFDVHTDGNWEEEHTNILRRTFADDELIKKYQLDEVTFKNIIGKAKEKLLKEREKRQRPGLDDKSITAWNALMIKALLDAAQALGEDEYYQSAQKTATFILNNLFDKNGVLCRNYKNNRTSIPAFLDDYALLIEALIALYQYDFNEAWLNEALELTEYVLQYFSDENSPMFFYTSARTEQLIARKHEVMDNVIPASNSVMAQNLTILGLLFDKTSYTEKAETMLKAVLPRIKSYGSGFSNWCIQLLNHLESISEIAIVGEQYKELRSQFNQHYIPNKIFLGGKTGTLPLLKDKNRGIYICKNKSCQLPVTEVEKAIELI